MWWGGPRDVFFFLRADCGTHFRSAEFLQRILLGKEAADLCISIHFDAEEHGKGECDRRFSAMLKFFESYGKQKPLEWKWGDQEDIGHTMADAIKEGTARNGRGNALPIAYYPAKHGVLPAIYAPIPYIKSSFCFRATRRDSGRQIPNCIFSQYAIGIPVRVKAPELVGGPKDTKESAGRSISLKRAITDSMRTRGRKTKEKKRRTERAIMDMEAPPPKGIPLK